MGDRGGREAGAWGRQKYEKSIYEYAIIKFSLYTNFKDYLEPRGIYTNYEFSDKLLAPG